MTNTTTNLFARLVTIMDELREQCPWDRKQTIATLRSMTIEETYELADAILDSDWNGIKEELGDLLLHIVFYARIGKEQSQFTLDDVMEGICNKLVERHPHIYGDVTVRDEEDVKRNWESIKMKSGKKSVLEGVPVSLPAVVKATRIQEKAKQVGFEWHDTEGVRQKLNEELGELQQAIVSGDPADVEEEFGDVLFSMVNYARFLHIDAEAALDKANKKFMHRFIQMEQRALEQGKQLAGMTLEEMDILWNLIKKESKTA